MKKSILVVALAFLSVCTLSSFTKKDKTEKKSKSETSQVYIFGFSASFVDSTVYFTPIQVIEGVQLTKKTKFLPDCAKYSYQLKDFLEEQKNENNRVCATFSEEKKKKIEKLFVEMKHRYENQKNLKVIYLTSDEFKFNKPTEETEEEPADSTNTQD